MLKIENLLLLNKKKISLQANPGEVIFIKGPNGTGKSLFLKSLSRLLPSTCDNLSLDGKSSTTYSLDSWRSKILYLPSEISFSDELTVNEYLAQPFALARYKDFVSSFFPHKYLGDIGGYMNLLSSGQRQRVALLRAMSLDADVLLLDESFGHMDQASREDIFNLLKNWVSDRKTLLIVSHYPIDGVFVQSRDLYI